MTRKPDIFDRIKLDLLDRVELDTEDKVIYSPEMRRLIREELAKEIAKIPVGKIIAGIMEKEVVRQGSSTDALKSSVSKDIGKVQAEIKKEVGAIKNEMDTFMEKIRKNYADLKNQMLSTPKYEFGGFSPEVNDLNIGDPGSDGAWRIVKSGTSLSFQRLEGGTWTEKGAMVP